jgi:uncharacterized protein (DUF2252 family)
MTRAPLVERIQQFNQGREPQLLHRKYKAMQRSPFVFLRGTCHLFYQDWPSTADLNQAPLSWICGDLHLENFGTFKGDNRLTYFDLNDFDEAALAPCTWDLARFLTSIFVGANTLGLTETEAIALAHHFLNSYKQALRTGRAGWIERSTATGLVQELLSQLKQRQRPDFLNNRTEIKGNSRRIRLDGKRALPIPSAERKKIIALIEQFRAQQAKPKFFKLLDVSQRAAGTGSLGIERYILLVVGHGSPDGNYLLDLKQAQSSALQPYLPVPQPQWQSQAERIVAVHQRVQACPPALLKAVTQDDKSFVLTELQPFESRVNLEANRGRLKRLERVVMTMGEVVAWGQLRSSGRQGSAIADELIDFAHQTTWPAAVLDYARHYSRQVEQDWREFREALKEGAIEPSGAEGILPVPSPT